MPDIWRARSEYDIAFLINVYIDKDDCFLHNFFIELPLNCATESNIELVNRAVEKRRCPN